MMKRVITYTCIAIASGASAQMANGAELGIVVMQFDEEAVQCGLSKDAIEERVKVVLKSSGIAVVPTSDKPAGWVRVIVGVLGSPKSCVAMVNAQIVTDTRMPTASDFKPLNGLGHYLICTSYTLMSFGPDEFPAQFLNGVEEVTKDCVGRADYK